MTREDAIECLSERVSIGKTCEQSCMVGFGVNIDTLDEALDVAISALRQQDVADKDVGKNEPLTNAQKIRSMSDEELAEFLWNFNLADVSTVKMGEFGPHMFRHRLKEWLQQPAEEETL